MYPSQFGKFLDPLATITHFHLQEGDAFVDFGAGGGFYMKRLADAVGKSGKVYLCEIQKKSRRYARNKCS